MDLHTLNVWTHIGAGALALLVGLVPLLAEKGSALHRSAGRWFVPIAAINLLTAAAGAIFFEAPGPLVAATASAAYQYASSLRALALRDRGPGAADALMAVAALVIGSWLLVSMGQGTATWTPMIGYSVIGFAMAIALYDLSRIFWRDLWQARARMLDHGLKMTGAYFAMMSAGFGNIFRDWHPFSQFGPSVLGLLVALLFALRYRPARAVAV